MIKKIFVTLLLSTCLLPINAQLNSSVNVEGEYEPLIIETTRLSTFPQGYKFELPSSELSYEFEGVVSDFRPDLLTMGVTGRQTSRAWRRNKGFLNFNIGSYLNANLHAGYYIAADSVNTLLGEFKFNSSSLYRIHGLPEQFAKPSRRELYNGTLSLNYTRIIGREGLFNAMASYRLDYFNYYGTVVEKNLPDSDISNFAAPSQTINSFEVSVAYSSSPSLVKGWHAEAYIDYFGYRSLYGPFTTHLKTKGDKETHLHLGGGYAFNFAENSAIALDAKGDFLFFSKPKEEIVSLGINSKSRNYGIVALQPSYCMEKNELFIRAGVDLAVAYDVMGYEPDVAKFYAAPDISIKYHSNKGIGLFLTATGGVTPSSLKLWQEFDPYRMPYLLSNKPVYSPLDAGIGLNVGPFAGFTGAVALRYAIAKNVAIGGWYQELLGSYPINTPGVTTITNPNFQTINLSGFGIDLNLQYKYGNMVEIGLNSTYIPQNGKRGIFNGFDRARWVVGANVAVIPVSKLRIEAEYEYRGVRNCYLWAPQELPGVNPDLLSYRLKDINNFGAKITYSILDNLDIYCSGQNLLNRRVDFLPGLQTEGIAICGGLYFEF